MRAMLARADIDVDVRSVILAVTELAARSDFQLVVAAEPDETLLEGPITAGAAVRSFVAPAPALPVTISAFSFCWDAWFAHPPPATPPAPAVAQFESALGPLTLGVNAAGIASAAPAESMPEEQWRQVIDVDLTGVFLSCQAEGQAMVRNGGGSIVNIASMSASIANRGLHQAHYNSAKAGVVHLGRSLAWEWAGYGVRVNSISSGYTYTPMTQRPEQRDAMEGYAKGHAPGP